MWPIVWMGQSCQVNVLWVWVWCGKKLLRRVQGLRPCSYSDFSDWFCILNLKGEGEPNQKPNSVCLSVFPSSLDSSCPEPIICWKWVFSPHWCSYLMQSILRSRNSEDRSIAAVPFWKFSINFPGVYSFFCQDLWPGLWGETSAPTHQSSASLVSTLWVSWSQHTGHNWLIYPPSLLLIMC